MIAKESLVKINPDCLSSSEEDDTALLDPERKLYFGLQGVASHIWSELKEEKSVSQIVNSVATRYEVNQEEAETDTLEFLNELASKNLVLVRAN